MPWKILGSYQGHLLIELGRSSMFLYIISNSETKAGSANGNGVNWSYIIISVGFVFKAAVLGTRAITAHFSGKHTFSIQLSLLVYFEKMQ